MLTFFTLFALLALPVLALAALVLSTPATLRLKSVAMAATAATLAVGYFAGTETLGRPKPSRLALMERTAERAVLVGSTYTEGEAIYLWLMFPGQTAPRAYVLPWSKKAAEALLQAQAQAEATGSRVEMRAPFSNNEESLDGLFQVPPVPPMPPKTAG